MLGWKSQMLRDPFSGLKQYDIEVVLNESSWMKNQEEEVNSLKQIKQSTKLNTKRLKANISIYQLESLSCRKITLREELTYEKISNRIFVLFGENVLLLYNSNIKWYL